MATIDVKEINFLELKAACAGLNKFLDAVDQKDLKFKMVAVKKEELVDMFVATCEKMADLELDVPVKIVEFYDSLFDAEPESEDLPDAAEVLDEILGEVEEDEEETDIEVPVEELEEDVEIPTPESAIQDPAAAVIVNEYKDRLSKAEALIRRMEKNGLNKPKKERKRKDSETSGSDKKPSGKKRFSAGIRIRSDGHSAREFIPVFLELKKENPEARNAELVNLLMEKFPEKSRVAIKNEVSKYSCYYNILQTPKEQWEDKVTPNIFKFLDGGGNIAEYPDPPTDGTVNTNSAQRGFRLHARKFWLAYRELVG